MALVASLTSSQIGCASMASLSSPTNVAASFSWANRARSSSMNEGSS